MKTNHITNAELDLLLSLADLAEEAEAAVLFDVISDPFNPTVREDINRLLLAVERPKVEYIKPDIQYTYCGGWLDDFGLVVEKRGCFNGNWKRLGQEQVSKARLKKLFEEKLIGEIDFGKALDKFDGIERSEYHRYDGEYAERLAAESREARKRARRKQAGKKFYFFKKGRKWKNL